mgnify:CR=1 FL=1
MVTPYIGEIRMAGFTFAPTGWAKCDGTIMNVTANEALFSLLGSTFGGDGRTTFGLPDLKGRLAVGVGQGTGLSNITWGQQGGTENETISSVSQLASHTHNVQANSAAADSTDPNNTVLARAQLGIGSGNDAPFYHSFDTEVNMQAGAVTSTGGNSGGGVSPHNNMQPFLVTNFIIALTGIMPTQT